MITVQKLAQAIGKRLGGTEAEALEEARTVMSYFGFRSVIIDNAIHPDDRKVFYALHDLEASVRLPGRGHQDQPAARTDGGDDPPARRELKPPRIRDVGSARGRHDAVVGGALGVAETAVPDHDGHGR